MGSAVVPLYRLLVDTNIMAFSNLYSAVCRGKWFVSFREVESNLLVVDKLLERDFDSQDTGRLSEREAIPLMIATKDGRSARLGNSFSDAPQANPCRQR